MGTGKIIQADKIQGLADVPNFLSNPNGLLNTSGWTEGSYTAGSKPTGNFTASSGAGKFSISRTTTNPLGMTGTSLVFTKASGNQQGRAVETVFALPLDYRAKVLKLSASYINTSTNATDFVAGSDTTYSDMIFYTAYSTDGGTTYTVAEPSSFKILSNSKDNSSPYDGTYQTPYNATHLKLIAYVATTSTTAWSIKAVLGVSPSQYVYGSPVVDLGEYTPIFTNLGTVTTQKFEAYKVGKKLKVKFRFTAASGGASVATVSLPPGLKISSTGNTVVGAAWAQSTTSKDVFVSASNGGTVVKFIANNGIDSELTGSDFGSGIVDGWFEVDILGWSSSVQMSDGYDGRVVAARITANYSTTPLTLSGTPQTIKFPTVVRDDVNGYNPATGIYTVPTSGWYRATASAGFGLSGTTTVGQEICRLNLIIGSASFIDQGFAITTTAITGKTPLIASGINYLTAGQEIRVDARYSGGVTSGSIGIYGDSTNFSIEKLSGSPTISASETVACRYTNSAGTLITSSFAVVPFADKSFDTHGAYNASTGIFTAPISGKYNISCQLRHDTSMSTSQFFSVEIRKGSTRIAMINRSGAGISSAYPLNANTTIDLIAGESIDVRAACDTSVNLTPGPGNNFICITKVGN